MPEMTPVEEIRAAVEKLRKHVEHAMPGPWVADGAEIYQGEAGAGSEWVGETLDIDNDALSNANAAYIALMQPAVGRLLADWLELEADVITARTIADGTGEYAADISGDHALLIARQLNGTDVKART